MTEPFDTGPPEAETLDAESPDPEALDTVALTAEIERNRRAEYRLLVYTAVSLLAVAAVLTIRVLWL